MSAGLSGAARICTTDLVCCRRRPGLFDHAQHFRGISVRFVNGDAYSFAHRWLPPRTLDVSASNLQSGARIALLGMVINAALAIAKIVAGVLGNAYVLIADGIESTLDVAGSVVIWGGLKFAARPPDETHPYGHGKAEPVAAAIVAGGVIAAAIGLAIQSAREIVTPHHAPAPFTLVVLIAVVVVKELLYRSVIRLGRNVESTAVQTDAWHHRSDALTSLAAFVGITIALIGGAGWESADDWAALFACATHWR